MGGAASEQVQLSMVEIPSAQSSMKCYQVTVNTRFTLLSYKQLDLTSARGGSHQIPCMQCNYTMYCIHWYNITTNVHTPPPLIIMIIYQYEYSF